MAGPGVSRSFLEEVISKLNLNMKKKVSKKIGKNVISRKTEQRMLCWNSKEKVFCHRTLWLILYVTNIGSQSMTHWIQQNAKKHFSKGSINLY